MDFQEIRTYAEGCLRDTPPPCVSACPLGVDVRGLVSKARAGRIDAAYRLYREAVPFPRVVSAFCEAPCRRVCVRERLSDGFVDLSAIERDVVNGVKPSAREGGRHAIQRKHERVAVLGRSLCSLACAWRLAAKGYGVTIFGVESGFAEAGDLKEAFEADVLDLFRYIECEWREDERPDARALEESGAFDAVYEAAEASANGVAAQIARGLAAATAIEERFRIGELSGAKASAGVGAQVAAGVQEDDIGTQGDSDARHSGDGSFGEHSGDGSLNEGFYELEYDFSSGDTNSEAERCPMCNCSVCIDACTMIRWFKQNPKRIAADLGVSVLPVGGKIMRVGSRMMNSCNLCGLCTAVCPVGVDTCAAIESSRRILKESGHLAPAYHDFWMDDLAFSMSDEAYGIVAPAAPGASGQAAPLLFFPGCQLAASLPETVARTYDFIRGAEPGAAMLLGCCGVPADWAAEKDLFEGVIAKLRADIEKLGWPEVLFACSACKNTFAKALPEARGRLVYEWLAEKGRYTGAGRAENETLGSAAVYDPCNSRGDAEGQAAVRAIAKGCGYELEELRLSGEEAVCCGFGGHIYPANPKLLEAILEERAEDIPGLFRITYCSNCRDLFLSKGMGAAHILEILFSPPGSSPLPSLTRRRENRWNLLTRYKGAGRAWPSYSTQDGTEVLTPGEAEATAPVRSAAGVAGSSANVLSIEIPPAIEAKMDRLLLLRGDVEKTILHCEASGAKVIDRGSGRMTGYYRHRLVTVWVEYEAEGDGRFRVCNVYTHRMEIGEGSTYAASADAASGNKKAEAPFESNDTALFCARCAVPLKPIETKFSYLGHEFSHAVPKCPVCGQAYIPEELATGKIVEVESMLEDK